MLARAILIAAFIGLSPQVSKGEETLLPDVTGVTAATEGPVTEGSMVTVPAFTPLYVRIDEEISSKIHKNGDRFRIVIAEDVHVGGVLVIPAGSMGEGEVIHAAKAGAGGKPGELLVTARFVSVGDLEIRLRSFSLGGRGLDHMNESLAVSNIIGPFGMLVTGGVMIIPRGAVASARIAMEIQLPALVPADKPRE